MANVYYLGIYIRLLYQIDRMGNNNQKENDDFGRNFNMQEHNRKMAEVRHNYSQHDINYQREAPIRPNLPKQQAYIKMQRKNAIFKPSISINLTQHELKLSLQYNSQLGCELVIYLGVNNISQDLQQKRTLQVESDYKFSQRLIQGQKAVFKKVFPTHDRNLTQKQIIIRIQDPHQATQYSLRKVNQKQQHWKIILQKLQKDGKAYELENIYGSGQGGQQCIVCMSDTSNTLVKPCNHMCLCKQCAMSLRSKTSKCPICRKQIADLVTLNSN